MPYWQLYYHIIWATKGRQPLLTGEVEETVHRMLWTKAIGLGARVYAVNGMPDHIHMLVSIPPSVSISEFVGKVKATASTRFNKADNDVCLYWQRGYGVFSFDRKSLQSHVHYVGGKGITMRKVAPFQLSSVRVMAMACS